MTGDVPDFTASLLSQLRVPRELTTAGLRERFGDPDRLEPAPGQVRRAEWDGTSLLVLLLSQEERCWRVVPVSIEPTGEDESSLVVGTSRTTFPVEVTAWSGLVGSVPTGALSRVIDQWGTDLSSWCMAAADGTFRETPVGARRGRATDEYGASAAVRAALRDELDELALAPLVPVKPESAVNLAADATRVGLTTILEALRLPQPVVMKILQGKQEINEAQAVVLGQLFDRPAQDILNVASGLPVELAVELEQPRWRSVWRSMARKLDISESMARLRAGFGAFAMAYRQTGTAVPDWQMRIAQWVATNAQDPEEPAR